MVVLGPAAMPSVPRCAHQDRAPHPATTSLPGSSHPWPRLPGRCPPGRDRGCCRNVLRRHRLGSLRILWAQRRRRLPMPHAPRPATTAPACLWRAGVSAAEGHAAAHRSCCGGQLPAVRCHLRRLARARIPETSAHRPLSELAVVRQVGEDPVAPRPMPPTHWSRPRTRRSHDFRPSTTTELRDQHETAERRGLRFLHVIQRRVR